MLRTNLSTRPFYNERAVHWGLAFAAVAIVALTVFNVQRVMALSREQATLGEAIARDESRAQVLNAQAARVRSSIDRQSLERVISAAREANGVIDERTFSWTQLFNYIESTLPAHVMLTAVQPRVDPDGVAVSMTVVGREVEQIDEFIEKLEKSGAFSNVLATAEHVTEEGTFEVTLAGTYRPPPPKDAAAAAAEAGANADAGADEKAAPAASPAAPDQAPAQKPASGEKPAKLAQEGA
jgi:Tfp pilus assembly protein PilN